MSADPVSQVPVATRLAFDGLVDKRLNEIFAAQMTQLVGRVNQLEGTGATDAELADGLRAKADVSDVVALSGRVSTVEGSYVTTQSLLAQLKYKAGTDVTDGLAGRITSLEAWRKNKASFLGLPIVADLKTDYNTVTTVLSAVVIGLNATNAKLNAVITRVNAIQSALQSREISSAS